MPCIGADATNSSNYFAVEHHRTPTNTACCRSCEFNNSYFPWYSNYALAPLHALCPLFFSPKSLSFVHRPPFITSLRADFLLHNTRARAHSWHIRFEQFSHKHRAFPSANRKMFVKSSCLNLSLIKKLNLLFLETLFSRI